MIRSAKELRAAARVSLSGKWGNVAIFTLVFYLIMGLVPGVVSAYLEGAGAIVQLALIPLGYGFGVAFLVNNRNGEKYEIPQMFEGFSDYVRIWATLALMELYTLLWTLLLVIPGIIKSYSYMMTPYILRDHPELKYNAAIELSMRMMKGHKLDLFWLHLTFIGWILLCIITCGIALFWVVPYICSASVHFYEDLKAEYEGTNNE